MVDEIKDSLYNANTEVRKLHMAALRKLEGHADLPMQIRIVSPSRIQWADLANQLPIDDIRQVKIVDRSGGSRVASKRSDDHDEDQMAGPQSECAARHDWSLPIGS